jgi:hypothetical protein
MISKICYCGKRFETHQCRIAKGNGKYCSKKCANFRFKGQVPWWIIKKLPHPVKKGQYNSNWKGNNVGYNALHKWVKQNLIKPKVCQSCFLSKPFDLANKGIYDRNLNNWWWLCRKCHMIIDGRLERLKKSKIKSKYGNITKQRSC